MSLDLLPIYATVFNSLLPLSVDCEPVIYEKAPQGRLLDPVRLLYPYLLLAVADGDYTLPVRP